MKCAINASNNGQRTERKARRADADPTPRLLRALVFAAVPFSKKYKDVYRLGIEATAKRHGYACERADRAAFTGDVPEYIQNQIKKAKLVIADLTLARPNVYFEAGYALACGVPVLFVAQEGQHVHFDVSTQKCLFYRDICHLRKELGRMLRNLPDPDDCRG